MNSDKQIWYICSLIFISFSCTGQNSSENTGEVMIVNGFEIEEPTVPIDEIRVGTATRDAIPSIDDPDFISASDADFMSSDDKVIGLKINEEVRAYPMKILTWHEIVNDRVEGKPVVISYCPLCRSAYVFSRLIDVEPFNFAVSGLLYNSNVVMYDRDTESLWSQIKGEAINGPKKGTELEVIDATSTTWEDWTKEHPTTRVLSKKTGYDRNYERSPYGDYSENRDLMFPVGETSERFHPKALIGGIEINGKHKAYPIPVLEKMDKTTFSDRFQEVTLKINFDPLAKEVEITTSEGEKINVSHLYWFAWYAFHPETEVLKED